MRIIFDLDGKPQVSCSGDAYSFGQVSQPPAWRGMRVEVLIVDCEGDTSETFREGDAIYIHGRLDSVRLAFKSALRQLEYVEKSAREKADAVIARSIVCDRCGAWCDPKQEWHGDGKGNRCPPESA